MGSLELRLKKESLAKELATCKQNYEDIFRQYNREQNSANKNSFKDQLNEYLERIQTIDKNIRDLERCYQNTKINSLIGILDCHFNQYQSNILFAYQLALPSRFIKISTPQNLIELINSLLLPVNENLDNYLERFVGFLLLNQKTSTELKINLNEWSEEHIKNCQELLQRLQKEKDDREQTCHPGLMVAISSSGDSYAVEAWLIKNIDQYNPEAYSDCQQLKIDCQVQIPTDANLSNVPETIKMFIQQSFENCQKYLKQIHIFLPSNLMNHAVDCWHNWQEDEDDDATTIGEDYEVIIRCSERLRGKSPPVFKWREKGKNLQASLEQPASKVFILGDSKEEITLEKKLKQENAIAVTIATVFQQQQPGKLLWKSAVPLALWIRQQIDGIDNQLELNGMLSDCCLQQLPDKVKNKRLDAMGQPPETHLGRHLCLLWDDPHLLPPAQLLTENKL